MFKKILLSFLAWRVFLLIPLVAGYYLISYREGYAYTSLSHFIKESSLILHFLLSPWANFDGLYYLMIAGDGYTVNAGFFPLFPLLIKTLSLVLNVQTFQPIQFLIGLSLSNILFLASLVVFYKVIKLDYSSKIAFSSIIMLLLFPTSFFFGSIYSESLFLLLALVSFYFARKGNFFLAGISGMFLSATRLVGIAILPALIYEAIKQKKLSLINFLSISIISLGLISYIIFNYYKWGNYLYFIEAQGKFLNNRSVNTFIFFPQTIFRYIKIFFTVSPGIYEFWVAVLEFASFALASALLYLGWKQKIRTSYLIFAALCFLIPISTGTFTGLPRYIVVLFPIFISMALVKNKIIRTAYLITSGILLFTLLMLFSRGYFVS